MEDIKIALDAIAKAIENKNAVQSIKVTITLKNNQDKSNKSDK